MTEPQKIIRRARIVVTEPEPYTGPMSFRVVGAATDDERLGGVKQAPRHRETIAEQVARELAEQQ